MNKIINSYKNDGYIYCIHTKGKNTVKIGKTSLENKSNEETLTKLLNRYSTYEPNCYIMRSIRVGDCHKAEDKIFELLSNKHYAKEHYYYDEKCINEAFEKISKLYPNVITLIKDVDAVTLTKINKQLKIDF